MLFLNLVHLSFACFTTVFTSIAATIYYQRRYLYPLTGQPIVAVITTCVMTEVWITVNALIVTIRISPSMAHAINAFLTFVSLSPICVGLLQTYYSFHLRLELANDRRAHVPLPNSINSLQSLTNSNNPLSQNLSAHNESTQTSMIRHPTVFSSSYETNCWGLACNHFLKMVSWYRERIGPRKWKALKVCGIIYVIVALASTILAGINTGTVTLL